jgi:hypothetical protein
MRYRWFLEDKVAGSHLPGRNSIGEHEDCFDISEDGFNIILSIYDPSKIAEDTFQKIDLQPLGLWHFALKCKDFSVPDKDELRSIINRLLTGRYGKLLVHCGAGIGRTGLFLACYARIALNIAGQDAIDYVRSNYFIGAIETKEQEDFIKNFC